MRDWPVLAFAEDAPALISSDAVLTWRQLRKRVQARAQELSSLPDSPLVLLHARNSAQLVIEVLAHQERAHVPVLCNPRMPSAQAQSLFEQTQKDWQALHPKPWGVANIVFTSGSTGHPKAVVHSYAAQHASADGANQHLPFAPGDRWLVSLSLCHVGGLGILERALLGGGALVLPRPDAPLWASCQDFDVTHLSVVRTQLTQCLREVTGIAALQKCRAVLVGGGPCPPEIFGQALDAAVPVAQTWGLTETCAQVATSEPGHPDTCGTPLPYRRVKQIAEGRLAVAGPMLASGYLRDAAIGLPLDEQGFFPTQDRGELDAQGRVVILGRADLVFDSGGENIQPEQIERELLLHPLVDEVVVVPVAHPDWGHRPVAFLHMRRPVEAGALRDFLADKLPGFCIPDAFYPWPEPENRLKPSRARLSARASQLYDASSSARSK